MVIPDTEDLAHGVSPVNWLLVLLVWGDDTVVVVYHQLWRGKGIVLAFLTSEGASFRSPN